MTNDTRNPEEIERDIERERAGLTNTLDDLQDRFSVETIARQFTDQFREHGGDIGRSISDAVKRNPVALALTGVGLAWLMMGNRSGDRDRDRYSDRRYGRVDFGDRNNERSHQRGVTRTEMTGEPRTLGPQPGDTSKPYYSGRYAQPENTPSWAREVDDAEPGIASRQSNTASSVADAASSAADTARNAGAAVAGAISDVGTSLAEGAQNTAASTSDRASALREQLVEGTEHLSEEARKRVIAARESAIEARDAAMSYAGQGRERAVDLFEEQPLIAGALAVALGAALGAALPRSRMEDEYLGEQSDHLMEEAERIFAEEKEKLGKVATAATDEAKKVLNEAKGEADDIAKAAVDKARESGERITVAAEAEAKKQNLGDVKKA
jgi:hypothetical protein